MSAEPFVLRWGILSCGKVSKAFTKDLVLPRTHPFQPDGIKHLIAAAATRDSASRAREFLAEVGAPADAHAHGSYAKLVVDPAVDIVYVGTPHSHHYAHARMALEAGKHVLCEKAFTVNAAQARELVDLARKRNLFLMEAVWTRWFPVVREIETLIASGKLGRVQRVFADLSVGIPEMEDSVDDEHRLVNMELAGGAMLDIGIYSITWVFLFLYHPLPLDQRAKPSVSSAMTKYSRTGSDEATSILMSFPPNWTHGIATTHVRVSDDPDKAGTAGPPIRIQCTAGEVQVFGPAFRPIRYRVVPNANNKEVEYADVSREPDGRGMYWQADECALRIRDGDLQSDRLSWDETIVIMDVMDEVRQQNGLSYPTQIESLEYPPSKEL